MSLFRIRSILSLAALIVLAATAAPAARAATFNCLTNGGNWTTAASWTSCNGGFPSNGGGNTFDATVTSGTSTLNAAATVGNVTVDSAAAWLTSASGSTITLAGTLANSGTGDIDAFGGQGGTTVAIGGTLTNSGTFNIGNTALSAATSVTATGLNNSGTINLQGDTSGVNVAGLGVAGAAGNTGTTNVGAFSNLTVTGAGNAYSQSAGTTSVFENGTLSAPNVNVTGGTLRGNGTVAGLVNVSGAGTVEAINPSNNQPGTLHVNGAYTQSGGKLAALLSGTSASQIGTLAVQAGNAVNLNGGDLGKASGSIAYAAGQTFNNIVTFQPGQLFGTFGSLEGGGSGTNVNLGGGLTLEAFYNNSAGNISLQVVNTAATTAFNWTDAAGNWDTAGDWSTGTVPTPVADVTIGNTAVGHVSLGHDATINSLTINPSNTLTTTAGTLTVGGNVSVQGGGSLTLGGGLNLLGTVTVAGSGSLGLNNGGAIIDATLAGVGTFQTNAGQSGTLHAVTIDAGTTFTGNKGATTNLVGPIANSGTIQVNGVGGFNAILNLAGNTTLNGGGTVNLTADTGGGDAIIRGASQTLTNQDNEIQGIGTIGKGSLALINGGTVNANSNAGLGRLLLNGSGGVTNSNGPTGGLLEASNSGKLVINATVNNQNGNITVADGTSTIVVQNATIRGGTLNNAVGGTMETFGTSTLDGSTPAGALTISAGSIYTASNTTVTNLNGAIFNNGTIQLNGGGSGNNGILNLSGDTTLSGGGTVAMSTAPNGGGALFVGNGHTLTNTDNTISGTGIISNDGSLKLVNGGTIDATPAGGTKTLTLNGTGGVANNNLLEATGTGILVINTTVANGSGNITANGGDVQVTSAAIEGGTLNTTGGGTMETVGTSTLDGSTLGALTISNNTAYTANVGTTTNITGTITNKGTIQGNGGGGNGILKLTGDTVLNGGGAVAMSTGIGGGDLILEGDGHTLTNTDNTVHGTGIIGFGSLKLVNNATVDADTNAGTGLLLLNASGGVTNNSLIEATGGGTLQLKNTTIANGSGNITANAGDVQVGQATIVGGTLNTLNGGTMETVGGGSGATLDGSTLGALTISAGSTYTSAGIGTTTNLTGTIANKGTIALDSVGISNSVLKLIGNTTLNGGGTVAMSTAIGGGAVVLTGNGQTLTNTGNLIQGTGIIGASSLTVTNNGTIEALPAGGTSTLTLNGSGGLANGGTFAADGGATLGIAVPFTNTGTVHPINGTINANAGFTGPTGTAKVDAAGTLSIGADSTVGTLAQNGTLALGTHNITVSTDYSNANFGTGNSFNAHAGVTGTGKINAAGPTPDNMQVITGAAVGNGGTATPTLAFGNVHVGQSTSYSIANQGTAANPSLRGAIQTNVNGGNVTKLGGTGATAANFGPIAPGTSSTFSVTASQAGALAGQAIHIANNFDNVRAQTINVSGNAYNLASSNVIAPVNFGVLHVNDPTATRALTITNTTPAGAFSEGLDSSFGAYSNSGGSLTPSFAGSIANLAAGSTDTASMVASLGTATAGVVNGTITIHQASNGTISGLGNTALADQSPAVTGSVTATITHLAQPQINNPQPLDFGNVRIGSLVPTQGLSVTNAAPNDGFSEGLIGAANGASTPRITSAGGFGAPGSALAPQATDNGGIQVGVNTATAGAISGNAKVDFKSDGTPFGGTVTDFGDTNVAVSGKIFRLATGSAASPVDLGAARVGIGTLTGNLSVTNTAANDGFSENLDAAVSSFAPDVVAATGSVSGLAAGQTNKSGISVRLDNSSAGVKSGTATVQFKSNGTGIGGGAPIDNGSQVATVTGKVYTPAVANVLTPSPIDFGIVHVGDGGGSLAQSVTVQNGAAATALNDVLVGNIGAGGAPFSGNGNLGAGLAAGVSSSALQVALDTHGAGIFTGSANLNLASHDADLADLPLTTAPLALNAQVNNFAKLAFLKSGGDGSLSGGASFDLDFGNLVQGSGTKEALLAFLNDNPLAEQAFTDLLSSTGSILSGSGFTITGDSVSGLAGGLTQGGFDVGLDTVTLGNFDELLNFGVESSNSSGFDQVIGNVTLELEGNVVSSGPSVPEPSGIPLILSGLGVLFFVVRRRRRG